jgi:hypothetical protein
MKDQLWKLSIKIQSILSREEGQDLIEYALVVALIAFAGPAWVLWPPISTRPSPLSARSSLLPPPDPCQRNGGAS